MSKTEPLSNVDAAWLRMEDPTNLMMVSSIMTFDEPLNLDHFMDVVEYRWLKYERFRQRVVQPAMPLSTPYWETDPNFDLRAHIHRIALPAPGDHKTLQTVVSDLMSTPLDYSKPLWQVHIIENYGRGCALMARLHHCIADGMALMAVLLSFTDLTADAPRPTPEPQPEAQPESGGRFGRAFSALVKPAASAVTMTRQMTGKIIQESLEMVANPSHALELARQGTDAALAASRLTLRTPDPKTLFKGELGVAKRAAWSRPLALRDIKAIKNVTGGTVNDVLITAMTGGLRRYMQGRGARVDDVSFRAAVPVNLRTPEEMGQLGNKFGLVFLSLPIDIADPFDRLLEVNKRMDALKNSPEAVVAFGILNALGMSPSEVQNMGVKLFGTKATAVMTNVPGPTFPLYLAGSEIKEMMFWVPQSGRLGLGISIISYAGKVWLGVATDAGLVPDPDTIIEGFYEEFEALMELVRLAATADDPPSAPIHQPVPATTTEPALAHCQGITKSGRPCKNRPLDGSNFCRLHQKTAEPV